MKLNLVALVLLSFAAAVSGKEPASPALEIKEVVEANLKATQNEDVEAVMATMHSFTRSHNPISHRRHAGIRSFYKMNSHVNSRVPNFRASLIVIGPSIPC